MRKKHTHTPTKETVLPSLLIEGTESQEKEQKHIYIYTYTQINAYVYIYTHTTSRSLWTPVIINALFSYFKLHSLCSPCRDVLSKVFSGMREFGTRWVVTINILPSQILSLHANKSSLQSSTI